MTENLKRCPFCGGEAKCIEFYGLYHVICCNCHIAGKDCPRRESAVSAWNNRPIEDAQAEEIKRLREVLEHAVTTDTTIDEHGIWLIDGKTFQTWAADVLKGDLK